MTNVPLSNSAFTKATSTGGLPASVTTLSTAKIESNAMIHGTTITTRILSFVRWLRENHGYLAGVNETEDVLRLTTSIESLTPALMRTALKSSLCTCHDEWQHFDEMYDAYWLRRGLKTKIENTAEKGRDLASKNNFGATSAEAELPVPVEGDTLAPCTEDQSPAGAASSAETLASTDFRHLNNPDELAQLDKLAVRMASKMHYRLSRRQRLQRKGKRLDLRKSIHNSLPYGGLPLRLAFRKRRLRPQRLVILLDVSGSMNLYSQFFIRFICSILDKFHQADAFVFHTRLVQISVALREPNMEKAIEKLALMSNGWSGGTKIGECLEFFNTKRSLNLVDQRTVVMIVSDGYDTGSPELLATEMNTLSKRAKRIIWLNPMIGWQGYQPIATGMVAAMPHIDLFAAAHNLKSLLAIEKYLTQN